MKQVAILGDGAWGTAVATVLAHNGCDVVIWCYNADVAAQINAHHRNERFLPGISLDPRIVAMTDINAALAQAEWVFVAIPVIFLRSIITTIDISFFNTHRWVLLSKGIEQETLLLPTQIIEAVFKGPVSTAVVAGPSFAYELARQQVTGFTVAAVDATIGEELQQLLATTFIQTSASTDLAGVQACSAFKNLIALGMGYMQGNNVADNTRALFFTRAMQDLRQLVTAMGGNPTTVNELCGLGDVVLTTFGKHSKNRSLGERLGAGESLDAIKQEYGSLPEGINTLASVPILAEKYRLNLPVMSSIHEAILGSN